MAEQFSQVILFIFVFIAIKSIAVGSEFSLFDWFRYKSKYTNWYQNRESFKYFLLHRTIRLTKAPKRFVTVLAEAFEYLYNNNDKSERYIEIGNELKIEPGSAIVFIEQKGLYKDGSKSLERYATYVVKSLAIAPYYLNTSPDGYDLTGRKRVAIVVPVVD